MELLIFGTAKSLKLTTKDTKNEPTELLKILYMSTYTGYKQLHIYCQSILRRERVERPGCLLLVSAFFIVVALGVSNFDEKL